MNDQVVAPVRFNKRTRNRAVERKDMALVTVGSKCSIYNTKPVLYE